MRVRAMSRGWLRVDIDTLDDDAALYEWIDVAVAYAERPGERILTSRERTFQRTVHHAVVPICSLQPVRAVHTMGGLEQAGGSV
jgi:hypothetical protein